MSQLERIFKRISQQPTKKSMLKAKVQKGYMPTEVDRKNLMVILKRTFKRDVNPDIGDVELLRMYLQLLYAKEVKMQEQHKAKKKAEQLAKAKIDRMLNIMDRAEIKRDPKTKMGSHYVKLVK